MAEYFTTLAQWIGPLQTVVSQWLARWETSTDTVPPHLYFKGDSDTLCDSRSGVAIEYTVGRAGRAILNHLSKPSWTEDIHKVFSPEFGPDVARQIEFLKEKRLVFQEGERLMSLVLNTEIMSSKSDSFLDTVMPEANNGIHVLQSRLTRSSSDGAYKVNHT